jgi:hypothetical protein
MFWDFFAGFRGAVIPLQNHHRLYGGFIFKTYNKLSAEG